METQLSRYWWLIALRGVVSVLFGIAVIALPEIALPVLVILFGAYALVDGAASVLAAIGDRKVNDRWWALALEGLMGVAVGIVTFFWPEITAVALLYLIAAWALVTGIFEIVAAIRMRKELDNEWMLIILGILSIAFAVVMILNPAAGALAVVTVIGAYAIAFGILLIGLSFRLKGSKARDNSEDPTDPIYIQ